MEMIRLCLSLQWFGEGPHDGVLRGRDGTYPRGQRQVQWRGAVISRLHQTGTRHTQLPPQ